MKKYISVVALIVLAVAVLTLASCGGSTFGLSVDENNVATIEAKNAAEGEFVLSGSLSVGNGQILLVTPAIEGEGAVSLSFIQAFEGIETPVEETDEESLIEKAALTETITGTEPVELAVPAGDYYINATVVSKMTGTITVEVIDAPDRSTVEPDYGTSELYTKDEMDAAVGLLNTNFFNWKGCEMHSIRYAGDECNSEENIKWVNELKEGKGYTQVIEFLTDFHSPVNEEDLEGTAWEPDYEYTDYQWWFARTEGGQWEFVSCGY